MKVARVLRFRSHTMSLSLPFVYWQKSHASLNLDVGERDSAAKWEELQRTSCHI